MRKNITISIFVALLVVILFRAGIVDSLLMFLLSGSIPGTPITLTPSAMMAVLTASAWVILMRVTTLGAINIMTIRRYLQRTTRKQERMPKRRYSRI